MNSSRVKYYIPRGSFFAESAMILLILAAVFRVIGCWGYWNDYVNFLMLLALPVCCCLLLALCILLFGKKGFFLSVIPVLLGVVFFVFKSLSFNSWLHTVLCILLYILVAVIYTATVFGWIGTKWLLPPLFVLPFVYHIVIEDLPALNNTAVPVTFAAGMQEMSILCIMAALFCVGMGLKKRPVEPTSVDAEVVEPPAEPVIEEPPVEPEPAAVAAAPVEIPAEPEPVSVPEPETEPEPVQAPEQEPAPEEPRSKGFGFFKSHAKKKQETPEAPPEAAEAVAPEAAEPAPPATPAEAAVPAEAAAPAAPAEAVAADETPFFSDQPYEPVLTLDPEPWEPEQGDVPESEHEQ